MDKLLITIPEAAALLGIGRTKAYELAAAGQLPTVHLGRARRVVVKDLQRLVETLAALEESSGGVR